MSRLVFMLEEPSMRVLLEGLLPRMFPGLEFLCIPHEGKGDLERSLPRKLRGWVYPGDQFVVVRDNDGQDCLNVKAKLSAVCAGAGKCDSLVRIVCQELEAWYFGEPSAMAVAFGEESLRALANKAKYRNPDVIVRPANELLKRLPTFQKYGGARRMAEHLTFAGNKSTSFRALIQGIARISERPLPG